MLSEPRCLRHYLPGLLAVYLLVWGALAIAPHYRDDWLLENVLVVIVLPLLLWLHRRHPLSPLSWSLIFVFGLLHAVGSHYTYAEVPYDRWLQALTGTTLSESFGLERNHFDRLVHGLFGLLMFHPLRSLVQQMAGVGAVTSYVYPLALLATISHLYELLEWAAAAVFGGELGMAYLGTQGDIWDAHKDMGLALAGAVLAAVLEWLFCRRAGTPGPTRLQ